MTSIKGPCVAFNSQKRDFRYVFLNYLIYQKGVYYTVGKITGKCCHWTFWMIYVTSLLACMYIDNLSPRYNRNSGNPSRPGPSKESPKLTIYSYFVQCSRIIFLMYISIQKTPTFMSRERLKKMVDINVLHSFSIRKISWKCFCKDW